MTTSALMPTIVRNTDTQIWRDLDWLIRSPSLVKALAHYPAAQFNLEQQHTLQHYLLSSSITEDIQTIGKRSRLGLYAEDLLSLALSHCPSTTLLHQHFSIQEKLLKGTKTIGELDYIWQNKTTQLIYHWELAVKLYLYIPEESNIALTPLTLTKEDLQLLQQGNDLTDEQAYALLRHLDRFVGTQKKDTLLRKLLHLQKKQLPLAQQVAQQLALPIAQSAYFMKGWLFYPLKSSTPIKTDTWSDYIEPTGLPWIDTQHLRGWWLNIDDFITRLQSASSHWRWKILPRLQWLSKHLCPSKETIPTGEILSTIYSQWQQFENHNVDVQPLLLCALQQNQHGDWEEMHRGFVVPPHFSS